MPRLPPQLPFEIITDILSRLPVKPLLRFKCVCKSWRSLISNDPQFAKLHLLRANQETYVNRHRLFLSTCPFLSIDYHVYCDSDDGNVITRELSYPPGTEDGDVLFVESCDGLISFVFNSDSVPQIIVWNPSTGESRDLPVTSPFPDDKPFFGFGFDSNLDDYKVVRGIISTSSTQVKMEVFSLKGSTWRTIEDLHCSVYFQGSATYLNGVLHWLVSQGNGPNLRYIIISFDLAGEKFLETLIVPDHVSQNKGLELRALGDYLCVYSTTHTYVCQAWTIKGYGTNASWTTLFNFSSDPLPGCKYWLELLWVSKNGNVLFNLDGWELVLYNTNEQTSKQYSVPHDGDWFLPTTYIESLVSPNAPRIE